MRESHQVLVKLGRIAYIAATASAGLAEQACKLARQERDSQEAGLSQCVQNRRQLSAALVDGGTARSLQHLLACDRLFEEQTGQYAARLDQTGELLVQKQSLLTERRREMQQTLARLRVAEKMLRRNLRSRRLQQERRQAEDAVAGARP